MRNKETFANKQVLVLGIARSGFAASHLLRDMGAHVTVNDQTPLEENERAKQLVKEGFKVVCGDHPLDLVHEKLDMVVKNPGIPYSNPIIQKAIERSIPVVTEVEIAGMISEARFVAITGSNGKTTTTTLIGEMLKTTDKHPIVAGNIGTAVTEVAAEATSSNTLVTELSSFQLQGTRTFKPFISVLLNIYDAHLDYHGTKENYANAKAKIFRNQTKEDFAVVNADDKLVMKLAEKTEATIVPFSTVNVVEEGAYIENDIVKFRGEPIIHTSEIVLPGSHHRENILAAVSVCKLLEVHNEHITSVLKTFTGVKHRLQFVSEVNGRNFYNDSKATNSLATQKAVASFEAPVILLAGGLDRGNDFDDLIPVMQGRVKAVVAFGQTAQKIKNTAEKAGINSIELVDNVEEAVPAAYRLSESGDVVLLSPACASWDQYKTFEQRGDIFIDSVHKL
ncbi:UDP-N-acetylmuramoyl-L-alanine--D-glutamate ligase [Pseudalkalibacillus caeni]|uniref:UDP-N-acetylmuramoylalanine--D-glutamate ligase n=1 Tax=Exobacillus caeni TaxID=2574798 RepID=A0A5R9EVJ4_9BACL|nr:UDP-N-acetylmuramoyl-L-alanine--D-glutamate ligase [Pseudalkalibacillus caeni]TLS35242.1 UDP-N-acetylmuramoyl-L-alanine--D-glutamate ligase [Pseudalkalibacillus caeni]